MGLFNNPAKDAKKIQETIDYRVLKAAWDGYAKLHAGSLSKTHRSATPAWYALFSIRNYKGDFKKFDADEMHLLEALTDVNASYDNIIESLESNQANEELARHILTTHPNLQDAIPHEYDNVNKINGYIVAVIKQYQLMLSDFYSKYQKKIDNNINRLKKDEANKEYDVIAAKVAISENMESSEDKNSA